jgi:hypothetical protein
MTVTFPSSEFFTVFSLCVLTFQETRGYRFTGLENIVDTIAFPLSCLCCDRTLRAYGVTLA